MSALEFLESYMQILALEQPFLLAFLYGTWIGGNHKKVIGRKVNSEFRKTVSKSKKNTAFEVLYILYLSNYSS